MGVIHYVGNSETVMLREKGKNLSVENSGISVANQSKHVNTITEVVY